MCPIAKITESEHRDEMSARVCQVHDDERATRIEYTKEEIQLFFVFVLFFRRRRRRSQSENRETGTGMGQDVGVGGGKEDVDVLSRRLRFWMPSWPMRALSPKREKPRMELSRAIDVE
jgi:hypothetical protein